MSTSFITNENIDLLWEIILEEEFIRKVVSREKIVEFRNYFIVQIKEFQNATAKLNIPLVQLNKQFITNFIMVMRSQQPQPPVPPPNQNKQLYTSQEIQAERKIQFENDLTKKQNEFTRGMSVPVPEIPKFSEDLDKPIGSAMDELIAKTLAERNYDIQQIQRQMPGPPPQQKTQQTQQQIKYIKIGEELKGPVMTPIDVTDVFDRIPVTEKTTGPVKNVSWGENEYQEYNSGQQQIQDDNGFNHLFSKLKKTTSQSQEQQDIQDLKMSVSEIQKQMTSIHEKIEILLNRIK
uniref:Uncharacterized protein n=1 Tax=viral metagenome TaxID=1070528 RepID=A0A6C0DHI7_9ZZZZ